MTFLILLAGRRYGNTEHRGIFNGTYRGAKLMIPPNTRGKQYEQVESAACATTAAMHAGAVQLTFLKRNLQAGCQRRPRLAAALVIMQLLSMSAADTHGAIIIAPCCYPLRLAGWERGDGRADTRARQHDHAVRPLFIHTA